jgi:hypothetical protein
MKKNYIYLISLLVGLTCFLFVNAGLVTAQTTITVNTGSGAIANDGLCSLPEAIINANNAATHPDCVTGSGADVINLTGDAALSLSTAIMRRLPAIRAHWISVYSILQQQVI